MNAPIPKQRRRALRRLLRARTPDEPAGALSSERPMREVAANAMSFLKEAAELEGIDFDALTRDLPPFVDARGKLLDRIDWNIYAGALELLERKVGCEGVERIGALTAKSTAAESIRTIAGAFISSKQLYKAIVRWFGPAALNNLEYEYVELGDGRVAVTIHIPEPHRSCRAFFHLAAGSYRTGPGVLGQADALVEFSSDDRTGRFFITPPPDLTVWKRVRRAVRVAVGAERAIAELSSQQKQVQESFKALAGKHEALEHALVRVQESESSLSTLLDSIGDAVIATDAEGRITRMNPIAQALTSWHESEARGQPLERVMTLIDEDTGAPAPSSLSFPPLSAAPAHLALRSRDGTERPIAKSGAPIRSGAGPITGIVIVFRDITEERKAERALRRSEALLHSLLDGTPDALVISSTDGRIVRVNAQAETLFGYARSELVGKSVEQLMASRSLDSFHAERASFGADPRPGTLTRDQNLFGRKHDGTEFPLEINRSPLDSEGGRLELAAIRDVTDRKKLEQQVQHAQKMDAVGRLAGGIAHDFNNLLAAMMSFTNFALESLPEGIPAREDLGEVLRAAERAKALIRQLLAFSRQQVIDPRVVDAREILAGMEKLLRRVIGEDVELFTRVSPDLWAIELDPSHFEQIAVNLAANARDAMPNGGRLTIELDNFQIDEEYAAAHPGSQPGAYVRLSVTDTGMGMPEAVRARIFEPFFTTKAAGQGSGLGLATCYGIMRQLGGHILAYSELGHGTTMTVYFPRAAAELKKGSRSTRPPATRGGEETVLVVEDDPAVRAAAVRSLKRKGYHVLQAASGAAALSLSALHEGTIDVLLTDLVMPNMGGRELAAQLVIERPGLRVVYMSGYAEHAVFQHGVLEPGLIFVQKPFVPDELARRIREALDAPTPERTPASA